MVILDDQGRVLALERADLPDAWQLPQGGIEDDESPVEALWRELREETGLTEAQVHAFAEVPEWLGYELPPEARSAKTGQGQVHKWFVLRAVTSELSVNLPQDGDREFRSWRWVDMEKLAEQVVAFRQPVYRRLAQFLRALA